LNTPAAPNVRRWVVGPLEGALLVAPSRTIEIGCTWTVSTVLRRPYSATLLAITIGSRLSRRASKGRCCASRCWSRPAPPIRRFSRHSMSLDRIGGHRGAPGEPWLWPPVVSTTYLVVGPLSAPGPNPAVTPPGRYQVGACPWYQVCRKKGRGRARETAGSWSWFSTVVQERVSSSMAPSRSGQYGLGRTVRPRGKPGDDMDAVVLTTTPSSSRAAGHPSAGGQ